MITKESDRSDCIMSCYICLFVKFTGTRKEAVSKMDGGATFVLIYVYLKLNKERLNR